MSDKMREEFEAWASVEFGIDFSLMVYDLGKGDILPNYKLKYGRDHDGEIALSFAFEAWKASRAALQASACAGMADPAAEIADLKSQRDQWMATAHEFDIDRQKLADERDELLAALEAAVDCGMVPPSSAKEGGAVKYARQVVVADMIRDAI